MKESADICFVVYSNETYFDLLELTLPFTIENTRHLGVRIYVVSNKIPNGKKIFPNVNYIDSQVNFCTGGGHFSQTMTKALNSISEKYIFFLCDDYIIKSPVKKERFDNITRILDVLDGDYISFSTQKHLEFFINEWKRPDIDVEKFGFPKNSFFVFDDRARHMYSVQPCVWKKDSLSKLLKHNPNISLHGLDNTDIMNMKGETRILSDFYNNSFYVDKPCFFDFGFKNYCVHFPLESYHVDEKPIGSDFFLLDYIEIVRHGKFLEPLVNSKIILTDILNSKLGLELKNKLSFFL